MDRVFIATNVELTAEEGNDDRSLCRYEFYEILTRIAKVKFMEKGIYQTMHESLEALYQEFIIPNYDLSFDYKSWREENLWNLDIDELYRENLESLKKIFENLKKDK